MALPPHTPFVLLSAVVGSSVAFFLWLYRDAPGAKSLVAFMATASVWALAEGVALASPGLGGKVFWTKVAWSVSSLTWLAWLATALAYADIEWQFTRRRLGLFLVEPLLFLVLVWTNAGHGQVWTSFGTDLGAGYVFLTREFGPAFWAHTAYSYCLVAAGGAVLLRLVFRTGRQFRKQALALLVAVFVPMVANAVSVFDLVAPQFDLTSIAFVVTGAVVAVAVLRDDLMSVAPVTRELGREAVVDEVDDPVLIVDGDDRVVDLNPAAEQLFGVTVDTAVGESLRTVSESLVDVVAGVDSDQVELELGGDGEPVQYYDVRVSSLDHAYGTITGRVISLREVTDRQQREQRLDVLNRLLRHNLRNEMNLVRGNAELLRSHLDTTDPAVEERLSQIESTVDTVVERGDKVGQISRGLDSDETRPLDLATLAADAADTVRSGHDDVTVTVDVPEGLLVQGTRGLERVIVELLENAVEHGSTSRRNESDDAVEHGSVSDPAGAGEGVGRSGEAVTVAVTAAVVDGVVELSVSDDGTGIDRQERVVIEDGEETALQHGSGVGLWLVRWIVREHGGTVTFEDCEDGTTVVVRLPLAERRNRAGAAVGGAD